MTTRHKHAEWYEQGQRYSAEPLTVIEQEGFGLVCAILDIEGESVYRILQAMNAHDDLVAIASEIATDSRVDLIDSERRIRLYSAIHKATGRVPE